MQPLAQEECLQYWQKQLQLGMDRCNDCQKDNVENIDQSINQSINQSIHQLTRAVTKCDLLFNTPASALTETSSLTKFLVFCTQTYTWTLGYPNQPTDKLIPVYPRKHSFYGGIIKYH